MAPEVNAIDLMDLVIIANVTHMHHDGYQDFPTEAHSLDLVGRTGTVLTKGIRSCWLRLEDVTERDLGDIKIWIAYRRLAYPRDDFSRTLQLQGYLRGRWRSLP